MFGMELTHGADRGGASYPFVKPAAANRGFAFVLEELLREVWRGIENAQNTSGPNPTDDESLANLARELQDMLIARRGDPSRSFISREEFNAVAAMDWLYLTVRYTSPIIEHLVANGPSAAERTR